MYEKPDKAMADHAFQTAMEHQCPAKKEALIMFLNTWSQFQIPLILASSLETKPVAIVVSEFMTKDSVQYGLTAAAGMIAVVPPATAAFDPRLVGELL